LSKDPGLLDAKNSDGETPLHQGAKYGQVEVLDVLLDKGSNVNAKTPEGATPLHFAAAFGQLEAVRLLVARGADVDPREETGITPIMAARAAGHDEVVKALKAAGADDTAMPPLGDLGGGHFVSGVSDSDPLMQKTIEKARSTLDVLASLFKEYPRSTTVKFPFKTQSGEIEHVWGDLLELNSEQMKLRIRTSPSPRRAGSTGPRYDRSPTWRTGKSSNAMAPSGERSDTRSSSFGPRRSWATSQGIGRAGNALHRSRCGSSATRGFGWEAVVETRPRVRVPARSPVQLVFVDRDESPPGGGAELNQQYIDEASRSVTCGLAST
jgi:hypothetical protein